MRFGPQPWRRFACALLLAGLIAACSGDEAGEELEREALQARTGEPVPYEVTISGVDEELASFLRDVSQTVAGRDDPPQSVLSLRRRAAADADRLREALGSQGYYDATVAADVQPPAEDSTASVAFAITPGTRYQLADVRIEILGERFGFDPSSPAELGLERGEPAVARRIIDAQNALVQEALAAGHAYAEAGDRQAIIDTDTKTMDLTLRLRPGPPVALGRPTFEGTEDIDDAFLENRVEWEPGATYSPEAVRGTNRALVETGLFRSIEVQLPETAPDEPATVPVTVVADQRLHRTISAGIRFETDGGPGGDIAWEHRNFFGSGEQFRAALDADLLEQSLGASLRTPDFYGRSRSFLAEAEAIRETTDAFDSLAVNARAGIEQEFTPTLTGSLGLGFELSEVTEQGETESFGLLFVPALLRFDNTDDPLNPQRGARVRFEATPFWDVLNQDLAFQRFRLDGSTYFRLTERPDLLFAVRGAFGSIVGANRDDIPANRRFYAGGGGSVRGIPFQTAAPLDEDDDPIGGRSLLEVSFELRYRITESIGAVAFVDGGQAFEASYPDFDDGLQFGAGLGLRYFTPIGPLRVDVAVPVDRRNVDDAFQFYISLGQAF